MTLRAAAEQALDTLAHVQAHIGRYDPPVVTTIARSMQPAIDALRAALAAKQPQPACPHIRSSGTGEWATHWCALNGPPSAEPVTDAMVEAAFIALHGAPSDYMFTASMRVDAKERVRAAIDAALAAREGR